MRVAIVADWFLKLFVEGQAVALRNRGHDVLVICRSHALEFGGIETERSAVINRLRGHGVGVLQVAGSRFGKDALLQTLRIRRVIREWQPDVVSAHENSDPRLWGATRRYPTVFTVHDPTPHPGALGFGRAERAVRAMWLYSADAVAVHGDALCSLGESLWPRQSVVSVPLGIDVPANALPEPDGPPSVLLFGRLEAYKGVEVLGEAMKHVWDAAPRVRLVVAGRGPAAVDVPVDPRVQFINRYIAEDEVPALLASSTVAVLPYTEASQSGVGLLASAHGLPTVVSSVGALGELGAKQEWVVPPNDPQALAVALMNALTSTQRDREMVRLRTDQLFSWPTVAKRYEAVYGSLLGEGRPGRLQGRKKVSSRPSK